MHNHTKAIISIVVAGIILVFVVLANRASAPTPEQTQVAIPDSVVPITPEVATTTATTTAKASRPAVTVKTFTLSVGQQATVDGYKFALTNIEDSRCPDDVVCVWAGEVRAHIQAEYGSAKKEVLATYPGSWVSVGGRSVRITKVLPSYPSQNTGSYMVFLEAQR